MPEGDTIHRAAHHLRMALAGKRVEEGWADARRDRIDLSGVEIEAVSAHGKNLLILLDDGRQLRTHMMMTGSWHIYRPEQAWR